MNKISRLICFCNQSKLWLSCMLLQDSSLQLWFTMSESWIFFLLSFQHLWFLLSLDSFCISSPFLIWLWNKLLLNWCESARDFEYTQRLLCICESSLVIEFTFHSLSIAIIPSNCSNLLQFLQNNICNNSHIVFNISIIADCSVEKSDSIVDLIFIRTTIKKTDCSIAWCNNYRWQTDSSFDFDVVIVYSSNSCVVSSRKFLKWRIDCVSYWFEAVCCWHFISILLINLHWLFSEFCLCSLNIIFASISSSVGWDCSHTHELSHISHHFKQQLFIVEENRNSLKYYASMFIIFFFDCLVCLGIGRVFELGRFVLHDFESSMQYLWECFELLSKHYLTAWKVCLGLIQVSRPLVSIAFNYKWFEELSHCSISMFCSVNDVCDSITHKLVSYIQLNLRIQFSHLQEICSFDSIFCWKWLNIASNRCSVLWITCNFCCLISRIWIQCCFFIE